MIHNKVCTWCLAIRRLILTKDGGVHEKEMFFRLSSYRTYANA